MTRVDDDTPVPSPTLEDLLRSVFDMTDTELDVCLCVMESGTLTVQELADDIEYDRSVVTRHLNHLAALGVLEKRRRLLESGGHVYVYSPAAPDEIRRRLRHAFLGWVAEAIPLVEGLRREKVEAIVDADDPQWRLYQPD